MASAAHQASMKRQRQIEQQAATEAPAKFKELAADFLRDFHMNYSEALAAEKFIHDLHHATGYGSYSSHKDAAALREWLSATDKFRDYLLQKK